MKEDFSELVEYLDGKFGKVDEDIKDLRGNMATKEDLKGLASKDSVAAIADRLVTLEEKMEDLATREDMNTLTNAVDAYAKKADTYFQEMAALGEKLKRHDRWLQEIAEKVGVELKS